MADKKQKADATTAEVREQAQVEQEQGYVGTVPDTTPNQHYTVDGVTSGKPTPETDREQAERNRQAAARRRGEA